MSAYVEIIRADGRSQIHDLVGDRVTVGTSADASVAIPDAAELEPLHLLLVPQTTGCWSSAARGASTEAWVGGKRFENGVLPWGSEIDVGSITLRIHRTELEEKQRVQRRRRWIILGAMGLVLVAGSWLIGSGGERLPSRPADAPVLFDDLAEVCSERDADRARACADDAMASAPARLMRYPFDAQDGVQAVHALTEAFLCYAAAGRGETAAQVARERDLARAQIEEDYAMRVLRLDRLLAQRRLREARSQARALLVVLAHRSGPYTDWLTRLDRHLGLRVDRDKKGRD